MFRTSLLQAKAGVLLLNTVDYQYLKKPIEARCLKLDAMRSTVTQLDAMGFLRPGLARGTLVVDTRSSDTVHGTADGVFERLTVEDDTYVAAGRARLTSTGAPADAVLLASQNLAGDETVFAVAEVRNTGDILTELSRDHATALSWRGSFSAKALPPSTTQLSAWAFDATTGQAYRLTGTHAVEHTR